MGAARIILVVALGFWFGRTATSLADTQERTTVTPQYRITSWNSEQGLPQNTVACLLQSQQGYLWIGTRWGLARFDGMRLTDYSPELAEASAADMDVRGLAEDPRGCLWLHTQSHMLCYREGRFHTVDLSSAPFTGEFRKIIPSRRGGVWVARRDGIFRLVNGRIEDERSLAGEVLGQVGNDASIENLLEDSEENLWVRIGNLGTIHWHRINPRTGQIQREQQVFNLPITNAGGLCQDQQGRMWLASPNELLCWDRGSVQRYPTATAWQGHFVKSLVADSGGNLWVSTEGPVQLHKFTAGTFATFTLTNGAPNTDDIRCLLPDREGNLWVGTGSAGIGRLQPRQLVSLLTGSRSARDEVYSVASGKEGRVWLATTYGLVRYQGGQFTIFTNREALRPVNVARVRPVLEHSSGEVFFGLDFSDLQTLRDGKFCDVPTFNLGGPVRRRLSSLAEDANGTLWIATYRGLVERRDGNNRLWTTADGLSDDQTSGLACAPDGAVWVGTLNGGVNELKAGHIRHYGKANGLLSENAWPLRVESNGTVWVGTPVGLNRIRGHEVRSVTMRDGLFDNLAYCLLDDARGNYWTFGNRGIWRVSATELDAVADGRVRRVHCVVYGEADGMASAEGNGDQQPNAARLPNGELWFPTTRGVVILDPKNLPENKVPPLVVIEEVRVDEETVYRDGGYYEGKGVTRYGLRRLCLSPGRARILEVRYTANSFVDPEKTRFRYRLNGVDEEWREADTQRVALYTNLRPGSYDFLVEACNQHGYWSPAPTQFAFELAPFFYQTWPFYGVCGLAVAAGFGGWHLRRVGLLRRGQRLKQEQALQEERSRIAKDLHDDLGANLTGIALQLDVASREVYQSAILQTRLQSLAGSVRGIIDTMRQVVWSLNPQCDTLESFCAYVCEYTENFLGSAGLRCRLDVPEEMPARLLSAETRHHLVMAMKEALNNAAKHASAGEVRLGLQLEGDSLEMLIADDGFGLPPESRAAVTTQGNGGTAASCRAQGAPGSARGLENMRRRVESLGGDFQVVSSTGHGTQLRFRVPLNNGRQT